MERLVTVLETVWVAESKGAKVTVMLHVYFQI